MKFGIHCDECDRGSLLDEQTLAAEPKCPHCGAELRVPPGMLAARRPSIPPYGSAAPVAHRPPDVGERAESAAHRAVCPRCKLHFSFQPATIPTVPESRGRILVVEDMDYFQQIAVDALESDYDVRIARNSREARAALAEGGIDLMILDLTLENGEDGRLLLGGPTRKTCPVLIYTAQDESEMYGEHWEELRRLGADDILIKGMKVGEALARKVAVMLGSRVGESEIA